MKVGTKSVILGVHAILLHPFFVAWAWTKLFGFPWDPRLWVAFFIHDLGYLGKPNMEGREGQQHVVLGGRIVGWLFGPEWRDFVLCHSRHWAESVGKRYSKLCLADKLAFVLTPAWLYLPLAWLSGELREYMRVSSERQLGGRVTDFESSLLRSPIRRFGWRDSSSTHGAGSSNIETDFTTPCAAGPSQRLQEQVLEARG